MTMKIFLLIFAINCLLCGFVNGQEVVMVMEDEDETDVSEFMAISVEPDKENLPRFSAERIRLQYKLVRRSIIIDLGANKKLQGSIEMTIAQERQISKLRNELDEVLSKASAPLIELSAKSRNNKDDIELREAVKALEEEVKNVYTKEFEKYEQRVAKILIPFQVERIDMISSFVAFKKLLPRNTSRIYWPLYALESMELTSEERQKVEGAVAQATKKLKETIEEAEKEALEQVISSFPESRRKEIQAILGEKIDYITSIRE
jgi:uncharacterized membrane protein